MISGYGRDKGQTGSFSFAIRSPRLRRGSLAIPPIPPLTCEESAHYPIFNPQDPRHNPAIRASSWLQDDHPLSQASNPTGSVRWMQSLPRRSLRRARSGLLALRSGMHRRSITYGSSHNDELPGMWSLSDSTEGSSEIREGRFSSAISEASTEEDFDFGTDLYRTDCKCPSDREHDMDEYLCNISSHIPSVNPAPSRSTLGTNISPEVFLAELGPNSYLRELPPGPFTVTERLRTCNDKRLDNNISNIGIPQKSKDPDPERVSSGSPSSNVCAANHVNELTPDSEKDSHCISLESSDIFDSSVVQIADNSENKRAARNAPTCSSHSIDSHRQPSVEAEDTRGNLATDRCELVPPTNTDASSSCAEKTFDDGQGGANVLGDTEPHFDLGDAGYYLSIHSLPSGYSSSDDDSPEASTEVPTFPSRPSDITTVAIPSSLNLWPPIDRDDASSVVSWRDEYFLVDGKSNGHRPDRGDTPTKAEGRFTGDGALYSGPGLDRSHSSRAQEVPEVLGPGRPIPVGILSPFRAQHQGSDSTDDYLYTYSLFHRHYFS